MLSVEEERATTIRARLEKQTDVLEFRVPALIPPLLQHLSRRRSGQVRLGGVWAVRMKVFARSMLVLALSLLMIVAVARWLGIGWTPRYVTLIALGFGALLLLSTLGARPRNPLDTGVKLTESGYVLHPLGINGACEEAISLSNVRKLSFEGYCTQHLCRNGDMVAVRDQDLAAANKMQQAAERFMRSSLSDRYAFDLLMIDIDTIEPTSLALVASLKDGRDLVVASQPADAPIERLLALAALLVDQEPSLAAQATLFPADMATLPTDDEGTVKDPGEWRYSNRSMGWAALTMLGCVLGATTYWLIFQAPPIGDLEGTPGWLHNIYAATPYLLLMPLVMAAFRICVQPGRLVLHSTDTSKDFLLVTSLLFALSATALIAFFGFRDIQIGVPVWVQVASGVLLVLSVMFRKLRRNLWQFSLRALTALHSLYAAVYGAADSSNPGLGTRAWQRLVESVGIALLLVVFFLLLVGLGKLSGYLMGMSPQGGGGKTAVPLYFDLIIIGLLLCWVSSKVRVGSALFWVALPAFIWLVCWAVIAIAVPGMGQLNPIAIVFYLSLNALIGQRLLSEA